MRTIKFRAWNRQSKSMLIVASLGTAKQFEPGEPEFGTTDCITELYCLDGHFGKIVSLDPTSTVMQYTGLKDKNGVEIYEGDIVRYNTGETWVVSWDTKQAGFVYMNVLIGESDGRKRPSGVGYGQLPGSHEVEVIGNIFESPELLEKAA